MRHDPTLARAAAEVAPAADETRLVRAVRSYERGLVILFAVAAVLALVLIPGRFLLAWVLA